MGALAANDEIAGFTSLDQRRLDNNLPAGTVESLPRLATPRIMVDSPTNQPGLQVPGLRAVDDSAVDFAA